MKVDERMHTEMVNSIRTYHNDSKVMEAWDAVQKNVCSLYPKNCT